MIPSRIIPSPRSAMIKFRLGDSSKVLRRILCLGAHSDDIEIGCGGTILRLLDQNPGLEITWIVFSSTPQRRREAGRSASFFVKGSRRHKIILKSYRDGFFPYQGSQIKEFFERLKKEPPPDLIFTHFRTDLHQDHRLISELTWNTFRDHFILEYEIPKYDGDLGSPNFFVGLDELISQKKIQSILDFFASQKNKPWFTEEVFRAIMRIRGMESNIVSRYAEAFYCRKMLLADGAILSSKLADFKNREQDK
jgi:LmbE family N-acetylglucosaminyl deacetylase